MNWRSLLPFPARDFSSTASDHRPALDGVRGIAILVVFLYDCLKLPSGGIVNLLGRKLSSAGWTGVDLFFVLSGFLITGILLDSRGQPGYFRSFFARRSLRIFPLYFTALWVTFVGVPWLAHFWSPAAPVAQRVAVLSQDQVWFWTYMQNWMFAFRGIWPDVNYLNHFWSLAVEEQFYLFGRSWSAGQVLKLSPESAGSLSSGRSCCVSDCGCRGLHQWPCTFQHSRESTACAWEPCSRWGSGLRSGIRGCAAWLRG